MKSYISRNRQSLRRSFGFTLIELLVVISIIALLIAILLPALSSARKSARTMQNNTQLRGIHQALFTYSQENKGFYTGLIPSTEGKEVWMSDTYVLEFPQLGNDGMNSATVRGRMGILVVYDYIPSNYTISPSETDATVTAWKPGTDWIRENNSYALLHIGLGNGTTNPNSRQVHLRSEWRDTASALVPIGGDRNLGSSTNAESVHTEEGSGKWEGGIVWNDGHTEYESTHILETTKIAGQTNLEDDIWTQNDTASGLEFYKNFRFKSESP